MNELTFSILLPAFNGSATIKDALGSILSQTYDNFEIIIQDDASIDATVQEINSLHNKKITLFKNKKNLGYSANLENLRKKATGDIIYLMGQDDILAKDALLNTCNAFRISNDIGAVTRAYYWFDHDLKRPVRAKKQLNPQKDEVLSVMDDPKKIITMFSTLDQLSGLAMRRKYIDRSFHQDIFPCHVYPFASIFKKHPVVFLKDYNTAVRIRTSQSRILSSIYDKSPLQSWVDLFNSVFSEEKFRPFRTYMISNFVAKNYVGLVQIRNYAKYRYLLREIYYLLKYRWQNIYHPFFWFFSIGSLLTPSFILKPMVDSFKQNINSLTFKHIKFDSYVQ